MNFINYFKRMLLVSIMVVVSIISLLLFSCTTTQMNEGNNTGGHSSQDTEVTTISGEIQLLLAAGPIQSSILYNVDLDSLASLIQPTETFNEAEGLANNILTEMGQTDENGLLTIDINSYLPEGNEFIVIYSTAAFDSVVREVMAAKLLGIASTDTYGVSYNEINYFSSIALSILNESLNDPDSTNSSFSEFTLTDYTDMLADVLTVLGLTDQSLNNSATLLLDAQISFLLNAVHCIKPGTWGKLLSIFYQELKSRIDDSNSTSFDFTSAADLQTILSLQPGGFNNNDFSQDELDLILSAYENFMIGFTDPILLHSVMSSFWHLSDASGAGQSSFIASSGSICSELIDIVDELSLNSTKLPGTNNLKNWVTPDELQSDINSSYCNTKAIWEGSGISVDEYNMVSCE